MSFRCSGSLWHSLHTLFSLASRGTLLFCLKGRRTVKIHTFPPHHTLQFCTAPHFHMYHFSLRQAWTSDIVPNYNLTPAGTNYTLFCLSAGSRSYSSFYNTPQRQGMPCAGPLNLWVPSTCKPIPGWTTIYLLMLLFLPLTSPHTYTLRCTHRHTTFPGT